MVAVAWWDSDLNRRRGSSNLSNLVVYYDFSWRRVFGHDMTMFPGGKSLTRLIREDCPPGRTPALFLTELEEFEPPWIEPDSGELIVVVPVQDYLAHSVPDAAASYYATRYGPGLTAVKQLREQATQSDLEELGARRDVVEAVVRHGLTADDVELWGSLEPSHAAVLAALAEATANTDLSARTVASLRLLSSAEPVVLAEMMELLRRSGADDAATQADFVRQLVVPLLSDDGVRAAFVQDNPELLAELMRNEVAAPDVAALARRRAALDEFEALLYDDAYFDARKTEIKGGAERVWQSFIEENPWVIGSSLAPQFLHSWSSDRLEQTIRGYSISGPGRRPDAVLRTAGVLSSLVLCEIKHHRTDLLHREYREGAWTISRDVAGGVAQCQATSDTAEAEFRPAIELTTEDGYLDERVFVCRPRTILVVGTLSQFLDDRGRIHPARFESFERFRRGLRDPEILTFDELFQRAWFVLNLQDDVVADAGTD